MSNPKIYPEMSGHDSQFMFQLMCEVHGLLDRRLAEYEKEADYQPYSHLRGTFCLKVAFSILRRLFQGIKTEADLHVLEAILKENIGFILQESRENSGVSRDGRTSL